MWLRRSGLRRIRFSSARLSSARLSRACFRRVRLCFLFRKLRLFALCWFISLHTRVCRFIHPFTGHFWLLRLFRFIRFDWTSIQCFFRDFVGGF
ncbi:pentapeptide repeat-containing protein [Vibrio porteresiae]|uniref:pentapeptide repeat-containing protein n=1 Tax=Vibrio porteresiae TaxID=435912 RepID=UPI003570A4BB